MDIGGIRDLQKLLHKLNRTAKNANHFDKIKKNAISRIEKFEFRRYRAAAKPRKHKIGKEQLTESSEEEYKKRIPKKSDMTGNDDGKKKKLAGSSKKSDDAKGEWGKKKLSGSIAEYEIPMKSDMAGKHYAKKKSGSSEGKMELSIEFELLESSPEKGRLIIELD